MNDIFWKTFAIVLVVLLFSILVLLVFLLRKRRISDTATGKFLDSHSSAAQQYSGDSTLATLQFIESVDNFFLECLEKETDDSLESNVTHHRDLSQTCNECAAKLLYYSDAYADPQITTLLKPFSELYKQYADLCSDYASYFTRIIDCDARNSGFSAIVEGAFRGMLGDPFGKRREVQSAHQELDSESNQLQKRLDGLIGVRTGLLNTLNSLAGRLAQQYGWQLLTQDQPES